MTKYINHRNVWDVASELDKERLHAAQEKMFKRIRAELDSAYADALSSSGSEKTALMLADWYGDVLELFGECEDAQSVREDADCFYAPDEDDTPEWQYKRLAFADL